MAGAVDFDPERWRKRFLALLRLIFLFIVAAWGAAARSSAKYDSKSECGMEAGDFDPERWRWRPHAFVELVVLVAAIFGTFALANWVADPIQQLKCGTVVDFELARPDDLPTGGIYGPKPIDYLVAACPNSADLENALRSSIRRDLPFIAAYVALPWWCCRRLARISSEGARWRRLVKRVVEIRVDRSQPGRRVARIVAWFVIVAGLLDLLENAFLWLTAGQLTQPSKVYVTLTWVAASGKFLLLIPAVLLSVLLLVRLIQAAVPKKTVSLRGHVALPGLDAARRWRVPPSDCTSQLVGLARPRGQAGNDAFGICLSGGGIRSATFGLGALQVLDCTKSRWSLRSARYLAAVSGGSYIAATYQFLAQGGTGAEATTTRGKAPPDTPLVPRSGPVEDHLRRHSMHLADGAAEWILALGEILLRALSGLVILLAVIWTTAVPLGWLYRGFLLGLEDGEPASFAAQLMLIPAVAVALFVVLRSVLAVMDRILDNRNVVVDRERSRQAAVAAGIGLTAVAVLLPLIAPHVERLIERGGEMIGVRDEQPPSRNRVLRELAALGESTASAGAGAAAAAKAAAPALGAVAGQLQDSLAASVDTARVAADLAARAASDLRASLAGRPPASELPADFPAQALPPTCADGPASRPPATPALDPAVTLACRTGDAAAGAADSAAELATVVHLSDGAGPEIRADVAEAANAAAEAAAKASAEIDTIRSELGTTPRSPDSGRPLAWAGLTSLVTGVGGLLAKRRLDVGTAQAPKVKGKGKGDFTTKLGFGGRTEIFAGILCAVILVVAFCDVLVDAWGRGPYGELSLGISGPAWQWWVSTVGALLIAAALTDVNEWSLRDFYHRRLWLPYAVQPSGKGADWREVDTQLSVVGARRKGFPELLICAAAQASGRRWAPPGRRAVSFIFSANACGGPEVGYVRTSVLEEILGPSRRRRPVTLFGAVATSGAAFGPAMGRQAKGGLGAVLAVANARLGAWIPNPRHLAEIECIQDELRWRALVKIPKLTYWFREILGQYPLNDPLVLTTDGGHIENLGLVELLRRRCDRIMAFDASGAGATPTTLAEALVMAREELGVRVDLYGADDSPLLDVKEFGADPFHRPVKDVPTLAERLAGVPVIRGLITYPPVSDGTETLMEEGTGILVYGTLVLTTSTTWDVLEYSQRNPTFPNDGTDKQWFRANTFAAYQQLGSDVAAAMLKVAERPLRRTSHL